jgi:hypothetical protein
LPLIQWTTVRLVVSENDWRRHDSEMEPGERKRISASHAEMKQGTRPEEDHSQIEGARSNSWAECLDEKGPASGPAGEVFLLTSLFIGFVRLRVGSG